MEKTVIVMALEEEDGGETSTSVWFTALYCFSIDYSSDAKKDNWKI